MYVTATLAEIQLERYSQKVTQELTENVAEWDFDYIILKVVNILKNIMISEQSLKPLDSQSEVVCLIDQI